MNNKTYSNNNSNGTNIEKKNQIEVFYIIVHPYFPYSHVFYLMDGNQRNIP